MRKFGLWRPVFAPFVEYAFKANGHGQAGKRIAYRAITSRVGVFCVLTNLLL
jgi:hypothetical protein